jgi:hypothetical protein
LDNVVSLELLDDLSLGMLVGGWEKNEKLLVNSRPIINLRARFSQLGLLLEVGLLSILLILD